MRKIDRNFCAWMMAGALAVGTLSGGWTAPAQVWAASEKKEEKQKTDEKAQEQQTEADAEGTVSPSDYVLQPQESYSYADMGLSFQLPEELLKKMESKEVVMLPDAELTEDGSKLKYGQVSWSTMTEEQREAEVDKSGDGYAQWKEGLSRIGALGTYHKDLEKKLNELTGCTEHEKIGVSEDGDYIYYLSMNKDADKDLTASLKKIETEITRMVSYNEEIIQDKESGFFNRLMARAMIYFIIRRSIQNEHRTRQDWDNFRKIQKSMGSVVPVTDSAIAELDEEESPATADSTDAEMTDEKKEPRKRGRKKVRETLDNLIPDNTDRIKGKITEFLKLRSSGNDLALLYIYLHEDSHIRSCDISTFHDALSEHYPEHKFVGLRGVQKAHQQLTTPMMGGKRMIDMGQDKKNLDNIRNHFEAA